MAAKQIAGRAGIATVRATRWTGRAVRGEVVKRVGGPALWDGTGHAEPAVSQESERSQTSKRPERSQTSIDPMVSSRLRP